MTSIIKKAYNLIGFLHFAGNKEKIRELAKKTVAILEIGSSKVSCVIGSRGVNSTLDILGYSQVPYAGFMEGEFLEPDALKDVVSQAVTAAETEAQRYITHMYVGVPAEFSMVEVRSAGVTYKKRKKLTEFDIDDLFDSVDTFKSHTTHVVVNRCPIFFELDDKSKVVDPTGWVTGSINATLSFVLAEREFVKMLTKLLAPMSIANIEFISEPLASSMFVVEAEDRDESAILVDCGYITTSVSVVMGDGLAGLYSFSLGGGHIAADLYKCMELPFNASESLKRKVVLNTLPDKDDCYELNDSGEIKKIEAKQANDVVIARIEQICDIINECILNSGIDYPENTALLLAGGGISYIPGAKDYLSQKTGRQVSIAAPNLPLLNKPHLSAPLGLLNLALNQPIKVKLSIVKLFNKK